MADKNSARNSMTAPTSSECIRNVVLIGPSGSGKTTLLEALLCASGSIAKRGSVIEGTTVGDRDPVAIRHQRSVGLAIATTSWRDVTINFLDTPGFPDFMGDLRAGLRGADSALFVVSATDGIDAATARLWDECEYISMPRAIVITNLDRDRADFDETTAVCHRLFTGGGGILPLFLPLLSDEGQVAGFLDLLDENVWDWSDGLQIRPADPEHITLVESARAELIEGVITESEDENLMDTFIAGSHVEMEQLTADLERAIARGHFHPVMGHAANGTAVGSELILDLIARGFPSPAEREMPMVTSIDGEPIEPLTADPSGPLCAEVIRTSTDPYVGKTSIVRVFSGTLTPDNTIHVSGHFTQDSGHVDHDVDERIGHISLALGTEYFDIPQAIAGSIVAVTKLSKAETGDTLSSPAKPLLMTPWAMPVPMLPVAITAHSAGDDDKLGKALGRLLAEDPTLRIEHTGQVVLWTLGEAHADLVLDRLRNRFGVAVDGMEMKASLRETFTSTTQGHGRLVKQSGGHGQYAVVDITVEPLPGGSGFEFVDKVVGGAIPRNFIPSVERGIRTQMEQGLTYGYPVADVRVTLVDGKAHSVDSSDMAFQTAGALALKDAADRGSIALLEPIALVTVDVPDDYVGAVMADIASRRGRVTGSTNLPDGRSQITAEVPESEISRYAIDIRSITHGTGDFTRTHHGFEALPNHLMAKYAAAL